MEFFSHQSIRKYTLGLLDTFNDIYLERIDRAGIKNYINVPISFGSKDKAFVLNQKELEQWYQGNYNVLPRMSLSLLTMNKDSKRDTSRLHTINAKKDGQNYTFQYNAVSYTFTYELAIATRSMSELTNVLEQILPSFNPSVRLVIKEMELHEEPTSIPVNLLSVDLDLPNNIGSEDDIRIVGATIMLELKGNIYQPFKDADIIKYVRLYYNAWDPANTIAEEKRSIKYEFSVDEETHMQMPETVVRTDFNQLEIEGLNPPVVSSILGDAVVSVGTSYSYKMLFSDVDDEKGFVFVWNIISGSATIFQNNINPISLLPMVAGDITIQGQVIDRQGNASNFIILNITAT